MTTALPTPVSARVPSPDEDNAAVDAARQMVKTVALGMVSPEAADFIPVTLEYDDGTTDSVFVLVRAHGNGDGASYVIGGVFLTVSGTTDGFKAWVDACQPLVEQAIDAFATEDEAEETYALPDPDEFARSMGIDPEEEA